MAQSAVPRSVYISGSEYLPPSEHDGYVASDREHPGVAVPEDDELIR
jgi:hypothetical protein